MQYVYDLLINPSMLDFKPGTRFTLFPGLE
jgi:hypothetical protein